MFSMYLSLGFEHIANIDALDHILFIMVLCSTYFYNEIKKILILVTAFTIGHSATLALSVLDIFSISTYIVELLIPTTIIITAFTNIILKRKDISEKKYNIKYIFALFFGLIHGLGFSFLLKSMLGHEKNIITPLFSFNIGIEIGQILIVGIFMFFVWIFTKLLNFKHKYINYIVSFLAIVVSGYFIFERI